MLAPALEAGEAFHATVVNMRFVKPLDEERVLKLAYPRSADHHRRERGSRRHGSAVNECLLAAGLMARRPSELPDRFI